MQATFIDLDELILLCRDESAKRFIQEAVACYRAGAYRSCIVSTWNALVFDFIHKLRELQQIGNGEATNLLEGFEKKRQCSDVKGLWKFESDIPKNAKDKFELISDIEEVDIARLLKDRNRCAHPSVISLDEPFEATAELARYHMRSAVTHLLQRPPVQGRQALERVRKDINSDYFPDQLQLAIKYLKAGPLERPRPTLVNDVVYELSDKLLRENLFEKKTAQLYIAIRAIVEMHTEYVENFLKTKLPKILDQINDDQWYKVVRYLREVAITQNLDEPYRIKTCIFIEKIDVDDLTHLDKRKQQAFIDASYVDFLREIIVEKLMSVPLAYRFHLEAENLSPSLHPIMEDFGDTKIEEFTRGFVGVEDFHTANDYANVWPKLFGYLDSSHHKRILEAFFENKNILNANHFFDAAQEVLKKQTDLDEPILMYWNDFRNKLGSSNIQFYNNSNRQKMNDFKILIDNHNDK